MLNELFNESETSSVSPSLQLSVNWRAFTSSHSTRSKSQCSNTAAAILHRWCHLEPQSAHPLLQSLASLSCRWNIFIAVDSAQTNTCEIRTTQKGNGYWISIWAMSSLFLPYLHRHPSFFTLTAFKISKSCAAHWGSSCCVNSNICY